MFARTTAKAHTNPAHRPMGRPAALANARPALGNQSALRRIGQTTHGLVHQAKLTVGRVNDPLEHEADRVADQVMRMPRPNLAIAAAPVQVSRKCAACEAEDTGKVQTKQADATLAPRDQAPASVGNALRGPGRPIDPATRAFFEPRFGRDFSAIRVHDDAAAAQSARDIGARAYAVGQHIAFADGMNIASEDSRRLMAHELAHVVQQTGVSTPQYSGMAWRKEDSKPTPPKGESPDADKKEPAQTMTNCAKNYLVESWETDTCCSNRGFTDPATKNAKTGEACCNTFPDFVDAEASRQGFDGAASCRDGKFLNHRARVTPTGSGHQTVDVLCVDTRAAARKENRVIELGPRAATKAYGSTHLSERATVCIGDTAEGKTCFLETDCNKTKHPSESQCLAPGCSKTEAAPAAKAETPGK